MYIQGFLMPVPEGNKAAYIEMAKWVGELMMELGAVQLMENWEADIADGKHTDFRQAVKAEEGEKIVFSWVVWPDKATSDAAHIAMTEDERFQGEHDIPFDGKRMVFGSFTPVLTLGKTL